jgi:hypothetical protein
MTAIRDEEIQKKGMVFVLYSVGQKQFHKDRAGHVASVWWLLPVRIVAAHVCYDTPIMDVFVNLLSRSMESHFLCRFRSHFGTSSRKRCSHHFVCFDFSSSGVCVSSPFVHDLPTYIRTYYIIYIAAPSLLLLLIGTYLECTHALMTFGIVDIPIKMKNGELDLEWHHQWLECMKTREKIILESGKKGKTTSSGTTRTSSSCLQNSAVGGVGGEQEGRSKEISVLGPMDIVMGRRRHPKSSLGYLRFRNVLDARFERYNAASKSEKTVIVDDIVKELRATGCRFVRGTPHGFVEEYNEVARDKVSHTLRNLRMRKKQK